MNDTIDSFKRFTTSLSPLPTGFEPSADWPLGGIGTIRALLFDVYGTLFISASGDIGATADDGEIVRRALSILVQDREPIPLPIAEAARRYLHEEIEASHERSRRGGIDHPEVDIRVVWRAVLKRIGAQCPSLLPVDESAIEHLAMAYEALSNPAWPMPGAAQVLADLRRAGMIIGIVSNAQFYTPLLFSALLGEPPQRLGFDPELLIWSYREGIAKPSPELFRLAAKRLAGHHAIGVEQTLYVGNDMLNDIYAAGLCGFKTCLFAGDGRSLRLRRDDPRCRDLHPDAVVTSLAEIVRLVPTAECP